MNFFSKSVGVLIFVMIVGLLTSSLMAQNLHTTGGTVGSTGSSNKVIVGDNSFVEPYSGFNGQGNRTLYINGSSTNVGLPAIVLYHRNLSENHSGNIYFLNANYTHSNKTGAQIKTLFDPTTKGTSLFLMTREGDGSGMMRRVTINPKGHLLIGTSTSQTLTTSNGGAYKLFVKGGALFNEVKVELGWADYVFDKNYQRISLAEEAAHIEEKGHLSGFLSAKEMDGHINLGDVTQRQQVKIEEMRLDQIANHETIQQQTEKMAIQAQQIEELTQLTEKLLERVEDLEK